MTLSPFKVWSDKARAAALAKRRGEAAPTTPQQSQTAEQAVAHANALIASGILNKGNKGKKGKAGGKAKAGGKGKAAAKPKAAKDPAIAKEHAQRLAEHAADRAQRAQDRTQRQTEHAQAQAEHAQSRTEHAADRTQRQTEHAAALVARQKAQADKAKQAKQKASSSGKAKAGKQQAATDKAQTAQEKAQTAQDDVLSTLGQGGKLGATQAAALQRQGLVQQDDKGKWQLTNAGTARVAARVQKYGSTAKAAPMNMTTLKALEADVTALKIGARNSRTDQQRVDSIAEHAHALGGRCPDCMPAPGMEADDTTTLVDPLMAKAAPPMDATDPSVIAPPAPDDEEAGEGEDDEEEEDTGHTGLMIALQVPPDVASELALDGEVAPEDLHLTLCFLGDAADFQKQQFQILGAVEQVIADAQPLMATIGGVGRFATPEDDGTNAFYASVDCPELADFRQSIVDALSAMDITVDESHGFTPHITLAYIAAGADTPASMPAVTDITFDTVIVAFGDHQVLFPLGDPTADQAALDAEQGDGADAAPDMTDPTTTAPLAKSVGDATMVNYGGAVKSMDSGHVGGYLVRFSGPNDPDLTGDFFTPDTDFGFSSGETLKTAVYFNHRLPMKTRDGREMVIKQKIGTGTLSMDDIGVFIDAVLYNREQYEATLGSMGWSSGTASHLVDREFVGKSMWVKSWQLGLDASVTPTPAEPRNGAVSLKAFMLDTQPEASASKTARSAVARSADVDSDDYPIIIIRRSHA